MPVREVGRLAQVEDERGGLGGGQVGGRGELGEVEEAVDGFGDLELPCFVVAVQVDCGEFLRLRVLKRAGSSCCRLFAALTWFTIGWNWLSSSLSKYSLIYWYGRSQQRNTQLISPFWSVSSERVPAALRFSMNWYKPVPCQFCTTCMVLHAVPCRLNPDEGPQTKPSRESARDRVYDSFEPTSSIASMALRQGNVTGDMRAYERGPGTRSPAAVQTLVLSADAMKTDSVVYSPYSYHGRLVVLEVSAQARHGSRSSHARTENTDLRQLLQYLWPCPLVVRFPILVESA